MSDLFDLVALLHEQNEAETRAAGWDKVHTLMVAPDVWATLRDQVPSAEAGTAPIIGVKVIVNRHLRVGEMVPLDRDGMPILKPASRPEGHPR